MEGLTEELKRKSIEKWRNIIRQLIREDVRVDDECGFCIAADDVCNDCALFDHDKYPICHRYGRQYPDACYWLYNDAEDVATKIAYAFEILWAIEATPIGKERE